MNNIIGIDPGFASMGLVRAFIMPRGVSVDMMSVVRTDKSLAKRCVLATEDNVRRAQVLADVLSRWITPDTIALCCESQSWPRNAGATAKVGMAWGVIAAIAGAYRLPVLQASPQQIKMAVTGNRKASKDDIIIALENMYDDLPPWPTPKSIIEHAADALAAIVACLEHPTILMARRLIESEA